MANTARRDADNITVPGLGDGTLLCQVVFSVSRVRLFSGAEKATTWKGLEVDLTPSFPTWVRSHALVTKRREMLRTPVSSWRDAWDGPGRATQRSPHTLKRNGVAASSGNTLPWKRLDVGRQFCTDSYPVHTTLERVSSSYGPTSYCFDVFARQHGFFFDPS